MKPLKKFSIEWLVLSLAALALGVLPARAAGEIVVANRYLLANQTSHAHLYLYREDGKLLRQLTRDNSGQDKDPIFSPDGKTIVWTRESPHGKKQFWSIRPRGDGAHRLQAAPAWYKTARNSNYFTNADANRAGEKFSVESKDRAPRVRTPDGKIELVLREDPADENDQWDGAGHGAHYLWRDLKSGQETPFGKLPGFFGVFGLLHSNQNPQQRFLWEDRLHLAFFDLHLDSTNGDTIFALDLLRKRLVRLSPNWAAPIPLPGQSAFLTWTENRYVPIPKTRKTANCRFVERYDENLHRVRYARTNCTVCYGASLYRPGQTPRVITIRSSESS
jgi:hypothetical protein